MNNINCISFDIGAGNGRAVVSSFDGEALKLQEVCRFGNAPVSEKGILYWDIESIMDEIYAAIKSAIRMTGGTIRSIGIDTWGAGFGILDEVGMLLSNPLCYRNEQFREMETLVYETISPRKLWEINNSRTYTHSALFQLLFIYRCMPERAEKIHTFLPIANLISYFLCGQVQIEPSVLSGSQFFDVIKKKYLFSLLDNFGICPDIFPNLADAGAVIGKTDGENIDVSLVCGHDTASAVTGIPLGVGGEQDCFILCGTWSVIGCLYAKELDRDEIIETDFTIWNGFKNEFILARIFSGFYFIQECKKQWEEEERRHISYEELYRGLANSFSDRDPAGNPGLINLTHPKLLKSDKNNVESLLDFFITTSQSFEYSKDNLISAILHSVILECMLCYEELTRLYGAAFQNIFLYGGGSRLNVFCAELAICLGVEIRSGWSEAAVAGNTIVQLLALQEIGSIGEGRSVIGNSYKERTFYPDSIRALYWSELIGRYKNLKLEPF